MDLTSLLEDLLDDLHAQTRGAELLAPLDRQASTAAAVIRFKLNLTGALVADGWTPPVEAEQDLLADRCLLTEPDDSDGAMATADGHRARDHTQPSADPRSLAEQADLLRAALEHRAVIDIAKGVVMGRYRLTEGRAWDHLVRLSQSQNVKLRDIAARVVEDQESAAHEPSTTSSRPVPAHPARGSVAHPERRRVGATHLHPAPSRAS